MPQTPEVHRYGRMSGHARESALAVEMDADARAENQIRADFDRSWYELAGLNRQISESKRLIRQTWAALAQADTAGLPYDPNTFRNTPNGR